MREATALLDEEMTQARVLEKEEKSLKHRYARRKRWT
jgi:hypothetical protein